MGAAAITSWFHLAWREGPRAFLADPPPASLLGCLQEWDLVAALASWVLMGAPLPFQAALLVETLAEESTRALPLSALADKWAETECTRA